MRITIFRTFWSPLSKVTRIIRERQYECTWTTTHIGTPRQVESSFSQHHVTSIHFVYSYYRHGNFIYWLFRFVFLVLGWGPIAFGFGVLLLFISSLLAGAADKSLSSHTTTRQMLMDGKTCIFVHWSAPPFPLLSRPVSFSSTRL